jgi:hypothetical protein
MRKLSHWALRLALVAAATGGIAVACYNEVPAPSAPLPPTREAKPLGSKPKSLPTPAPVRKKPVVVMRTEVQPAKTPQDGGVEDVVNLPPVPDATGLDAPMIKKGDWPDPDARLDGRSVAGR